MTAKLGSAATSSMVRGALAAVTLVASLVAVGFASGEDGLRSSFETALKDAPRGPTFGVAQAPVAGSEEFWLAPVRDPRISPVSKTVSVGDRIAMSLDGHGRTFEVQSVSEVAPQITAIDTTPGPSRFVLVTARDVAAFEARPVRFVMEVSDTGPPVVAGQANRAL